MTSPLLTRPDGRRPNHHRLVRYGRPVRVRQRQRQRDPAPEKRARPGLPVELDAAARLILVAHLGAEADMCHGVRGTRAPGVSREGEGRVYLSRAAHCQFDQSKEEDKGAIERVAAQHI